VPFELPASVPIFALPDVVLFPHAPLPLHVFELRYRTMVRDILSSHRSFVLALMQPGWERNPYRNSPVHPLACLARIEEVEWLVNDCYDLKVMGTRRVRLGREVRDYPYRTAFIHAVDEHPFTADDPLVELQKRALIDSVERLAQRESVHPALAAALDPQIGFAAVVNQVAMHLQIPAETRLSLLGMDNLIERSQRVRELVEAQLRRPERKGDGAWN
jgi:Lon protease-like protein